MKKIIFFSIDRLGDFLIRSNVIFKVSEKYDHKEIVSSDNNFKLINSQKYFDLVHKFNTKDKNFEKLKFIKKFFLQKYDSAIVFDGKNISNLILLLIKSNFKFTFLYKKKGFFNYLYLKIIIFLFNIFNIKYEYIISRDLIEKNINENYPTKYKILKKYYGDIFNKTYHIENTNIRSYNELKDDFIIIHLDEKFIDIKGIDKDFDISIKKFQKKIKKKVFLTSFKNNFNYYNCLTPKKVNFNNINLDILKHSDILIIEDMPLDHLYNLMQNSLINVSCHSGVFVHTSIALNKKTIDIIHKSQKKWLDTWIDERKNYIQIYKSNESYKYHIDEILNFIYEEKQKI